MIEPNSTDRKVEVVAITVVFHNETSGFCDEIAYCAESYSWAPHHTFK